MIPAPDGTDALDARGKFGSWIDCYECGGEGYIADCFDGFCVSAEEGCDDCIRKCGVCKGKGGWLGSEDEN